MSFGPIRSGAGSEKSDGATTKNTPWEKVKQAEF